MIVVGLSGHARHGKGSVVQLAQIFLQKGDDEREVRQVSFATALKQTARNVVTDKNGLMNRLDYLFGLGLPLEVGKQVAELSRGVTLDDLAQKTPPGRKLLQFIGTEAFRRNVDDLYWVKRATKTIDELPRDTQVVFVPDVRFPNEADYIRQIGGEVWRVERYVKPTGEVMIEPFDNGMSAEAKAHPSETALDGYNFDRTLKAYDMDSLFHQVEGELKRLGLL